MCLKIPSIFRSTIVPVTVTVLSTSFRKLFFGGFFVLCFCLAFYREVNLETFVMIYAKAFVVTTYVQSFILVIGF